MQGLGPGSRRYKYGTPGLCDGLRPTHVFPFATSLPQKLNIKCFNDFIYLAAIKNQTP
jgi:hypothetical protein